MFRWQHPEWLSLTALGTDGGQDLADDSQISAGIHLRWDFDSDLGFPPLGFDIYRRPHYRGQKWCAEFFPKDGGGVYLSGSDNGPQFMVKVTGEYSLRGGCGKQRDTSILLPGSQTVVIGFSEPARYVEILLDASTPAPIIAAGFWHNQTANIEMVRRTAIQTAAGNWIVRLYADRIDFVVLYGTDMLICGVCIVLVEDGLDLNWGQLPINERPICLPVTHPDWTCAHEYSPDDHAAAARRLPTALAREVRDTYLRGFTDELHPILYELVDTYPQQHYYVDEVGVSDSDVPAPNKLRWQALQLLRLIALDPNLARILGLYWHDTPPDPEEYYDYLIVGHWDNQPFPGTSYNFADLTIGTPYLTGLFLGEVQIYSPNPMTVIESTWDGRIINSLQIEPQITNAPIMIVLPQGIASVTLLLKADAPLRIIAYNGNNPVSDSESDRGEDSITIENRAGITNIQLEAATTVTLIELITRTLPGSVGDLHYVTFHHRAASPPPLPETDVISAVVLSGRSSLTDDGTPLDGQTVGLRWRRRAYEEEYLASNVPIFYRVRRADGGNGSSPDFDVVTIELNTDAPTLLTQSRIADELPGDTYHYLDRFLTDGWYNYEVQGIDLFGRLSEWGATQVVRVLDEVAPPPPTAVTASYLDPQATDLSQEDQSHAPGIKVTWEWSGSAHLQAPDVAGSGQFRIYMTTGNLNVLTGTVIGITNRGMYSALAIDTGWNGSADDLAGEWLRVGNAYFEVRGNTAGANVVLFVNHLTNPTRIPEPGPFSLAYSPGRPYWTDYHEPARWDRRLHIEPAVEVPIIRGEITSVAAESDGLRLTTDQALLDLDGALTPGVLISNGMVYDVISQEVGEALIFLIGARELPGDPPIEMQPSVGSTFVYYPSRRYQVYLSAPMLPPNVDSGTVLAHIAVSAADGKEYIADDPRWSQPQHGGLGNQPGNESALAAPNKIMVVQRASLPPPANVPPTSPSPIFAQPANYYGQARYDFNWSPVAGASEYAVYRCSGAALFDQDTKLRRERKGIYVTRDPFEDDPDFLDWLELHYPNLTADTLTTEAWRDWASHFYPMLTDEQIQALANQTGSEAAFRRINTAIVTTPSYTDSLDGRGLGFYLYRIRAINAAGVLGEWSETYPPVHIYDITPPAPPIVTAIFSGEQSVILNWRANAEADLSHYHLWRAEDRDTLNDVRRTAPSAVITPTAGAVIERYTDENPVGGVSIYYRIAAIDNNGNVSDPSPIYAARPVDTFAPTPPIWETAQWNENGTAVLLAWTLAAAAHEILVQRRSFEAGNLWFPITSWLPAGSESYRDSGARTTEANLYRLQVRSASGNLNNVYNEIEVSPFTGDSL